MPNFGPNDEFKSWQKEKVREKNRLSARVSYAKNRIAILEKKRIKAASMSEENREIRKEYFRSRYLSNSYATWDQEKKEKSVTAVRLRRASLPESEKEKLRIKNREWYANRTKEQRESHNEREIVRHRNMSEDKKKRDREIKLAWRQANKDRRRALNHKRRCAKNSGGMYTAKEWTALKEKFGFKCLRCHKIEPEIALTVDHVVPLIKGGSNTIDNLQPLCGRCNSSKKSKVIDYRGIACPI